MRRVNPVNLFKSLNIPIGYYVNPRPGQVPFMVYYGTGSTNLDADNIVYDSVQNWNIELYTNKKNIELEDKIEKILNENEVVWEKGPEIYISDDRVFMIPYYI